MSDPGSLPVCLGPIAAIACLRPLEEEGREGNWGDPSPSLNLSGAFPDSHSIGCTPRTPTLLAAVKRMSWESHPGNRVANPGSYQVAGASDKAVVGNAHGIRSTIVFQAASWRSMVISVE